MVVRLALPRALIDVAEDAEPELRILVEDLALGHAVVEMGADEILVLEHVLDERADFLAALDPRIFRTGYGDTRWRIVREYSPSIHLLQSDAAQPIAAEFAGTRNVLRQTLARSEPADAFDDLVPVVDVAVDRVRP